jgi:hypothetical protein
METLELEQQSKRCKTGACNSTPDFPGEIQGFKTSCTLLNLFQNFPAAIKLIKIHENPNTDNLQGLICPKFAPKSSL